MKAIEGFEGLYSVTKNGRVFSHRKGGYLIPSPNVDGYLCVGLSKDGKGKTLRIHRLVAQTYLKGRPEQICVNHIDNVKTNNHVSNLEWCTYSENVQHAMKILPTWGTRGEGIAQSKLKTADILEIRRLVKEGFKEEDLAEKFGVHYSNINLIVNRKTWMHI